MRHRECTAPSACAGHVLKQERKCRKGRCRREDRAFHVVLPPKRDDAKHDAQPTSPASNQQSDVRVLLSLNSIFYSSWSRWSPCSKSCTTTRYRYSADPSLSFKLIASFLCICIFLRRTCRFQVVCGNTVLHEEAYCYSKGTDCEKWYSANARQTKEEDGKLNRSNRKKAESTCFSFSRSFFRLTRLRQVDSDP